MISRRQFAKTIGLASALGLIESQTVARVLAADRRSLGHLAHRTASAEGAWTLTRVEGAVPRDLNGTLYRVAPGAKETFGVSLRHLFDGDAFVSRYTFREGNVTLRARFVDTAARLAERQAGKMLYREFGTMAPSATDTEPLPKNQPNVNIIRWDGRLLGLSEGGHPTAIDPVDLSWRGEWDFHGTLPREMTFTAHPRFDPRTGDGYAWGVRRGEGWALTVYRMERTGRLKELHSIPQRDLFMVHDVLLTHDHLVFVIPPVRLDVPRLLSGQVTVAEAFGYFDNEPTRFVILRKDGTAGPVTIEHPAAMVFHHGNAFETDGKIVVDSLLFPDGSVLAALHAFDKESTPTVAPNALRRLILDPVRRAIVGRTEIAREEEFPRFDARRVGADARYLYTVALRAARPLAPSAIVRHDLHRGTDRRIETGDGRVFGEPVFVPQAGRTEEDRGWLLAQGYDAARDETFLEIRDAGTLDFAARMWTGQRFPLGFHGNFYAA
jgi:all-trans-8'-apo-beta-carotenal 15,15'-oxygenase